MIHIALGWMVGTGVGLLFTGGHVFAGVALIVLGTLALVQFFQERW